MRTGTQWAGRCLAMLACGTLAATAAAQAIDPQAITYTIDPSTPAFGRWATPGGDVDDLLTDGHVATSFPTAAGAEPKQGWVQWAPQKDKGREPYILLHVDLGGVYELGAMAITYAAQQHYAVKQPTGLHLWFSEDGETFGPRLDLQPFSDEPLDGNEIRTATVELRGQRARQVRVGLVLPVNEETGASRMAFLTEVAFAPTGTDAADLEPQIGTADSSVDTTGTAGSAEAADASTVSREAMRASIREYFGGPAPEDAIDPEPEVLEKVDAGDHERWKVRYLVDRDEYGFGYLMLPKPLPTADSPLPLVLCPHPTADIGKDRATGIYDDPPASEAEEEKRRQRRYALELVQRGFIVFAPDRAGYGDRRLLPHDKRYLEQMDAYREFLAERYPEGFTLTSGKATWDLQRALDFLVEYPFVDASNIGTIGFSLGAWDSIMIIAMDDRVKAAVVNCGGSLKFRPELWRDAEVLRDYLANPKKQSLNVNTNVFLMLAAPRPVLYIWSIQDTYDRGGPNLVEGLRDISAYYEKVSGTKTRPERADISLFLNPHGHAFPSESRAVAYEWLEDRLGLPADRIGNTNIE